jgi:hypothetical protein
MHHPSSLFWKPKLTSQDQKSFGKNLSIFSSRKQINKILSKRTFEMQKETTQEFCNVKKTNNIFKESFALPKEKMSSGVTD